MNVLSLLVFLGAYTCADSLSRKIDFQGAFSIAVWDFLWQK